MGQAVGENALYNNHISLILSWIWIIFAEPVLALVLDQMHVCTDMPLAAY
jgi:hypothetical protein